MHNPGKSPSRVYDYLLGVLSTLAVPLIAFRVLYAMGLLPITDRAINAGTSISTVLFVVATFALAWRRSVLRSRIERADLLQRIYELEKRVTETENAAWWGTPPQEAEVERTVELDPTVVVFRSRESRQRGAS